MAPATFQSVSGQLNLDLNVANKSLAIVSTASSTYSLTLAGDTWSGTNTGTVTGNGTSTLTVNRNAFGTVSIGGTASGASLTFGDSGANLYTDNFSVAFGNAPGTITFAGATSFNGSNGLSITTSRNIVVGSGATVSTVDGNLAFDANMGATPTAGSFIGIEVNGGTLQSTGIGDVVVSGRGGTGSGAQGGVRVGGGGMISGGTTRALTVTGIGGATNGNTNEGVLVTDSGSIITSTGGSVNVTGTGGGIGASFGNHGIQVALDGTVSSNGGTVTLTGTAGTGTIGTGSGQVGDVRIGSTGGTNGFVSTTGNKQITIVGDSVQFVGSGTSIDSGAGITLIRPLTDGFPINIGASDSASQLGLTDAELDCVTAGRILFGSKSSGAITISAPVSRSSATDFNLRTADASTGVQPLASGTDLNLAGGRLSLQSATKLTVNVTGAAVDTQYNQLKVSGIVDLTGLDLALTGAYAPGNGEVYTIVSATTLVGTFNGLANDSVVVFNGRNLRVNYTATSVTLSSNVTPVFTSAATASLTEGMTAVQTIAATDADLPAQTITYSIVGGADQARFMIVGGNQLQFLSSPNFESPTDSDANNVYLVQLQANDGNGGTALRTVAVTVTNVAPTAPTDANSTANDLLEGSANGTAVGITASSSDPNGPSVVYSLSNSAAGRFVINSATGVVTVANASLLRDPSTYSITVQASDGAGGVMSSTFDINVLEAPLADVVNVGFSATAGVSFGGTVASFTDTEPGTSDPSAYAATIFWGDGSNSAGTIVHAGAPGKFFVDASGSPHVYSTSGTQSECFQVTISHGSFAPVSTSAVSVVVDSSDVLVIAGLRIVPQGEWSYSNGVYTTSATTRIGLVPSGDAFETLLTVDGTTIIDSNLGTITNTGAVNAVISGSPILLKSSGFSAGTSLTSLSSGGIDFSGSTLTVAGVAFSMDSIALARVGGIPEIQLHGTLALANGLSVSTGAADYVSIKASGIGLTGVSSTLSGSFTVGDVSLALDQLVVSYDSSGNRFSLTGTSAISVSGLGSATVSVDAKFGNGSLNDLSLIVGAGSTFSVAGNSFTTLAANPFTLTYDSNASDFVLSGSMMIDISGLGSAILATISGTVVANSLSTLDLAIASDATLSVAGVTITPNALSLSYSLANARFDLGGTAAIRLPALGGNISVTSTGTAQGNSLQSLNLAVSSNASLTTAGIAITPTNFTLAYSAANSLFSLTGSGTVTVNSLGSGIGVAAVGTVANDDLKSLALTVATNARLAVAGLTISESSANPLQLTYASENNRFDLSGNATVNVSGLGSGIAVTASGTVSANKLQSLSLSVATSSTLSAAGISIVPSSVSLAYIAANSSFDFSGAASANVPGLGSAISVTASGTILSAALSTLRLTIAGNSNLSVAGVSISSSAANPMTMTYSADPARFDLSGATTIGITRLGSGIAVQANGVISDQKLQSLDLSVSMNAALSVAGVAVTPRSLHLQYLASGATTFTVDGQAAIAIDGWNSGNSAANISLDASGTITNGTLSELGLDATSDTTSFTLAGVSVKPTGLSLDYQASKSRFTASGTATVKVLSLGGDINVDVSGMISNNAIDSFSVEATSDVEFILAGVKVTPRSLILSYDTDTKLVSFSGKADIDAPDLDLSAGRLAIEGSLSASGGLKSLSLGLNGNTNISVVGTTLKLSDPTLTYALDGNTPTFAISGGASISVASQSISVTMGTLRKPGVVIARLNGHTAIQSLNLLDGTAHFQLGAVSLDASDFHFQFDPGSSQLSFGGTVHLVAGPIDLPSISIPSIPINGGQLGNLSLRLPDQSFNVPALGDITITGMKLSAEIPLGRALPQFSLAGNINFKIGNTRFDAKINDLTFSLFGTTPILTTLDVTFNGTINIGRFGNQTLISVTATNLHFSYSNPRGLTSSLPSASITGRATIAINIPGFSMSNITATLIGDGLVIDTGEITSVHLKLDATLNYGLLKLTAKNLTVDYAALNQRFRLSGDASLDYFGLGTLSADLGTVEHPGIVVENNELTSLDITGTGKITVAKVELANAKVHVVYSSADKLFRASGSLSAKFGNIADLSLQMGTESSPGFIINKNGVIQQLQLSGDGSLTFNGLKFKFTDVYVYYKSGRTASMTISGGASADLFGLGKLDIEFGTAASPGLEVIDGIVTNLDITATGSIKVAGMNLVSASLGIRYDDDEREFAIWGSAGVSIDHLGSFSLTFGTKNHEGLLIRDGAIRSFDLKTDAGLNFNNVFKLDGAINLGYRPRTYIPERTVEYTINGITFSGTFPAYWREEDFFAEGSFSAHVFDQNLGTISLDALSIVKGKLESLSTSMSRDLTILGAKLGEVSLYGNYDNGALTFRGSAEVTTPSDWKILADTTLVSANAKLYLSTYTFNSYLQCWVDVGANIGFQAWFNGELKFAGGDPIPLDVPSLQTFESLGTAYVAASNGYVHPDDVHVTNDQLLAYLAKEEVANAQSAQLIESGRATVASGPSLAITEIVKQGTGADRPHDFEFVVSLAHAPTDGPVSVSFATEDVTAIAADGDYVVTSGTLTWQPGDTAPKIIRVHALPRTVADPHKLFLVRLTNASHAGIASSVGVGDILYSNFATTTTLTSSMPVAAHDQDVTYTATVVNEDPQHSAGQGFVRFYDGDVQLAIVPLVDGVATYTASRLLAYDHPVHARFTGWQIPGYSDLPSDSPVMIQSITRADQAITFAPLDDRTYGSGPVHLDATVSSGLPLNFRVVSGPASVSGRSLTITGAGDVVVEAYQRGDGNFNSAPTIRRSFNVAPTVLTLTFGDVSLEYGASLSGLSYSFSGFVNGDTASVLTRLPEFVTDRPLTDAGVYEVMAGGAEADNYIIESTPGTLFVNRAESVATLNPSVSNSVFGQSVVLVAEVSSVLHYGTPSGTISFFDGDLLIGIAPMVDGRATLEWTDGEVGDHSISAAFEGDTNFTAARTGARSLTVGRSGTVVRLTSEDGAVDSGEAFTVTVTVDANAPGSGTPTGFVEFRNGSAVIDAVELIEGRASILVDAGTDASLTVAYMGDSEFLSGSATLDQATDQSASVAITVASTVEYGSAVAVTVMVSGVAFGSRLATGSVQFLDGDTVLATLTLEDGSASYAISGLELGHHSITSKYSGDGYYAASQSTSGIEITPARSAIRLVVPDAVYTGNANPAVATIRGLDGVESDLLEVVALEVTYQVLDDLGNPVVDLGATSPVNAGHYRATASFQGSIHYLQNSVSADFVIAKAGSNTTVTGATFTYDGTTHSGGSANVDGAGVVTGSAVLSYTGDRVNAGSYTVLATYAGDDNHFSSSGTATITIGKAGSITTVTGATFTYDGTTHGGGSANVDGAGIVTGSAVLSYSGDRVNAGSYTVLATYSGDDNHFGSNGSATITIGRAHATITIQGYSGIYDGLSHGLTGTAVGVQGENLTSLLDLGAKFTDAPGGTALWSFRGNTNYEAAEGTASITITPRVLVQGGDLFVYGTTGNDTIRVDETSQGLSVLFNGSTYGSFPITGAIRVFGGAGDDLISIDRNIAFPAVLLGDAGADTLTGGAGNDVLQGGAGDDSLFAVRGNDILDGGEGNDQIWSGSGNDTVVDLDGDNRVHTGGGNDRVTVGNGANKIWTKGGNDVVTAGNGNNEINLGSGSNTLTVGNGNNKIRAQGGSDGDGGEGGRGSNVIVAGSGNNVIQAGKGADTITVGSGNNVIDAGDGDNVISVGGGANHIDAGNGSNSITTGNGANEIQTGNGNNAITTGSGNDKISTGNGNNTIDAGNGNNSVSTGNGKDTITTGTGTDTISAGGGDDVIRSGDGKDSLNGGSGDDILIGGDGDDVLVGGDGLDFMIGGFGKDTIVGDAGDDILIAAYTSFDNNPTALSTIMGVWVGNGIHAMRVANITSGNGVAGGFRLTGDDGATQTVFNDNDVDTLTGKAGQDWFLANKLADNGGASDIVVDLANNENYSDTDF